MQLVPQTRIYESILCQQYYHDGRTQIPEKDCKIASVQGEVAKIRAVSSSLLSVPGILLSVPYGQLADNPKVGRKKVLLLSVSGIALEAYTEFGICWFSDKIPLRLVWLAPLWTIFGGGAGVFGAVMFTMITDVVDMNLRATAFMIASLSVQLSQLIGPLLASRLMAIDPWVAFTTSTGISSLGFLALLVLPETIGLQPCKLTNPSDRHNNGPYQQDIHDNLDLTDRLGQRPRFLDDYQFLKAPCILILLSSFFLYWIGRYQMDLLVQYISIRYGQPLASAGLVLSMNATISLILLLVILPLISDYIQKTLQVGSVVKDLWLLKGSIVFLTVGCFVIGASPILSAMLVGDVLYILGTGFTALARSLLTVYVDEVHVARLHAIVSVVQMLGLCIGGPLLAALFDWGFTIGKEWTSLPFLGSAALHLFLTFAIWNTGFPADTTIAESP